MATAVAFTVFGQAVTWGTVATVALATASMAYSYSVAKKAKSASQDSAERKQILRSSSAPKNYIYGKTRSSGVLCFAQEEPGDQDEREWIHIVLAVAGHKINSITDVMLNDDGIGGFDGYYELATYPQGRTTVDSFLKSKCPDWTDTMIGRDFAWMRTSLKFNQEHFPSGLPNITMLKHGKEVEDIRTGTTAWSDNPALCILDYLRTKGWEDEFLILDTFKEAANICDELVDRPDNSGVDKRYTLGCEFDDSDTPASVLDKMLASCGGEWIRVGGRIGLRVAAYYGPAIIDITEDEIIDGIEIQPEQDRSDSFNIVRGTYVSPDQNYTEVDYPEVRVQEWVTYDEEEIVMDFDLDYVQNPWQAQRLADIALKRSRLGMTMKLPCNLRGFQCVPGTMINLSLPNIGFNKAEFMVVDWEFSIIDRGVVLVVRRDLSSFYDDAVGKPVVTPPLIDLPVEGVSAPSNPLFSASAVGDVVQGVISWTNTAFKIAYTNVIVKDSGGFMVNSAQVPFPTSEMPLNGRLAGSYDVELQNVAVNGAKSAITKFSIVIAEPKKPDSVNVKRSNWSVGLIPSYDTGAVPFGTLFEFRYLADSESYITGQPTYDASDLDKSEELDKAASSFTHAGLIPDRWQHYWVRAVNSYGKSDYVYVRTGTTKEQDLVTTVVERLVAIEIQSQNYDYDAKTGFKLHSPASPPVTLPDGTVMQNPDGLMVIGESVVHGTMMIGDIANKQGVIIDGDGNITSANYEQNKSGYKLSKDGRIDIIDGDFSGEVYVENLVGDIYQTELANVTADNLGIRVNSGDDVISTFKTFNLPKVNFARTLLVPDGYRFTNTSGVNCYMEIIINGVTYSCGYNGFVYEVDGNYVTLPRELPIPAGVDIEIAVRHRMVMPSQPPGLTAYGGYYAGGLALGIYKAD